MYNPAHFTEERIDVLYELILTHPLATLISAQDSALEATHLPLVLDTDGDPATLRGHFARANPHWRSLNDSSVLVIFHGPNHYITPNWYPSKAEHGKVVPTWNYVAVHVHGRARVVDDVDFVLRNVTDLTNHNEAPHPQPWKVTDAPPDYIRALARGIVGFEIAIQRIEGKWKLSQNRDRADRDGAIAGLESLDTHASAIMAAAMKQRE